MLRLDFFFSKIKFLIAFLLSLLFPGGMLALSWSRMYALFIAFVPVLTIVLISNLPIFDSPGRVVLPFLLFFFLAFSFVLLNLYLLFCRLPQHHMGFKRIILLLGYGFAFYSSVILVYKYKDFFLRLDVYQVMSSSMAPTLIPGDIVLADTSDECKASIPSGEIVFFNRKPIYRRVFLKRVYGVEGDLVYVLKRPTSEVDVFKSSLDAPHSATEIEVSERKLFLVGDNKERSIDSRMFGLVDVESVEACARFFFRPSNGFQPVEL